MAESSSDSDTENFVFYRDRSEWQDVLPVPQDDGPNPIVRIAYSEKFIDVYNYLRGIMRLQEKSERALALTKDAIALNPANYTVWHYRREILRHLGKPLDEELQYITKTIKSHPKNYQVWYHRQMLIDWTKDASNELDFTALILERDAKNYHAWQHRQWVIKTFSLWHDELEYTSKLILEDIRNNSAWNQRYFLISHTEEFTHEVISREIKYSQDVIAKAPNNESPWNYLQGILSVSAYKDYPQVLEFCLKLYSKSIRSPHLLRLMIDIYDQYLEQDSSQQELVDKILELCVELSTQADTIRAAYWNFIGSKLECKHRIPAQS